MATLTSRVPSELNQPGTFAVFLDLARKSLVSRSRAESFPPSCLDGLLLYANQAWATIWNVPDLADVIGKYNALQDPQTERLGLADELRRVFAGLDVEIPVVNYDPGVSSVPGRQRRIRARGYPLLDTQDRIENIVILNEDVTDSWRAQEDLRNENLFTSGYPESVVAHHGVLDEGTSFVQKPFSLRELTLRVREVLDG